MRYVSLNACVCKSHYGGVHIQRIFLYTILVAKEMIILIIIQYSSTKHDDHGG